MSQTNTNGLKVPDHIESVQHGVDTLDAGSQVLVQLAQMHQGGSSQASPAMLRGATQPMKDFARETRALCSSDSERESAVLISLLSVEALADDLLQAIAEGKSGWPLFVFAESMRQQVEDTVTAWHDHQEGQP